MRITIAVEVSHLRGPELTEDQVAAEVREHLLSDAVLWMFPVGSHRHSEYEVTGARKVEGLMDMGRPGT